MKPEDIIIISLGGSLIVPTRFARREENEIDIHFLKNFKEVILNHLRKKRRFFIITGGGKTARVYQKSASEIGELTRDDLDWLGIHATRLNAHLIRTIFRREAHKRIITNPLNHKEPFGEKIMVAAGSKPGWSTDYVAVLLAKKYGIETIINMSNVDYVFNKDPAVNKDAEAIKNISWRDFRKIIGNKWDPGLNLPFDPVASRMAEKLKLKVIILNGKNLNNFNNCLNGKNFKGTVIHNN